MDFIPYGYRYGITTNSADRYAEYLANPDTVVIEGGQEKLTVRGMIETIQHQQARIAELEAAHDNLNKLLNTYRATLDTVGGHY